MQTPAVTGRKAELLVQKSLWQRNYRVKDISKISHGCDILVNNHYRVEVKSVYTSSSGISINPEQFDVLAIVYFDSLSHSIYYLKNKRYLSKIRRVKDNPRTIKIDSEIIKKYFTKKAKEVFIVK